MKEYSSFRGVLGYWTTSVSHWRASRGGNYRVPGLRHGAALGFLAFAGVFGAHTSLYAQNPPLLDKPDVYIADHAWVYASTRLPDGSMVFGGEFSSVDGVPRRFLFKRRADGALDPDWNPTIDGIVHTVASDAAGNVYVGGEFRTVNGVPRGGLAKLSGDGVGVLDPDWFPMTDNSRVFALVVGANDTIYVGGHFPRIGGQLLYNLAKLSTSGAGAANPNWSPDPNVSVRALALDANGNLFVGGGFTEIGGWQQRNIAKVSASSGAVDTGWNPSTCEIYALAVNAAGSLFAGGDRCIRKVSTTGNGAADPNWQPAFSTDYGAVNALALDAAGNVWVGGSFRSLGGLQHLAKVSGITGAVDANWNPAPSAAVRSITFGVDGKAYIGGDFDQFAGLARLALAVVSPAGVTEAAMDVEQPGKVAVISRQPDGGTIVGGNFMKADGYSRHNLLRLRADGTVDPDWNPSPNYEVEALAIDAAGRVYVGGSYFDRIGGLPRTGIARVSGSGVGAVDPDWAPDVGNFGPHLLLLDTQGDLFMAGFFSTVDGLPRAGLVKMRTSSTGEVDPLWNPAPGPGVYAMALDAGGNLFIGGDFTSVNGQPRTRLAKLAAGGSGALDPDWKPSASSWVNDLAVDQSGNVFVAGHFQWVSGESRLYVAKLSANGSGAVDLNWNASLRFSPYGQLYAVAVDAAGNAYIGGRFVPVSGQAEQGVRRLSVSGVVDQEWTPSLNGYAMDLAVDTAGEVWVGGDFSTVDGQLRTGIAAFGTRKQPDRVFADGFQSSSGRAIAAGE